MLSAQFSETMMFPMSKALQADLEGKLKDLAFSHLLFQLTLNKIYVGFRTVEV